MSKPQTDKPKRGRPVEPIPTAAADELIAWIEQGKTLREWCRQPNNPPWRTVYNWLDKDEEFAARLARARQRGLEALAMECQHIADENCIDQVDVQRNRLRIETRLKLLAIWDPKRYGPKSAIDHGGSVQLNVITGVPKPDASRDS